MENHTPAISIDTAALLIGTSKRTLWRRLSAGTLQRHSTDERGRVMLALSDLAEQLCVTLSSGSVGGGYWRPFAPTGGGQGL